MKKESDEKEYYCHFELTLDIIGGKWKPIILYYLGKEKVLRYSDIKKYMPKINERVLTRQLRELERNQLISRKVYDETPPRVEYSLTREGEKIIPILLELKEWGRSYNKKVAEAKVMTEEEREKYRISKKL